MKETMETYILQSPMALKKQLRCRKKLLRELLKVYDGKPLLLVASGSSYNACSCAKPYMEDILKADVKVESPDYFVNYENDLDKYFIVSISQSGTSTNAIQALDKMKKCGKIAIGISGAIDSPMKEHADIMIDYGVGIEKVGYVTKGMVTLVMFMDLLALEISLKYDKITKADYDSELVKISALIDSYPKVYEKTNEFITDNFKNLTSMWECYVLGNRACYGIALEGALKIGETVMIPSFAFESEEYLHGPNLQLDPTYSVFVLDGNDHTSERTKAIFEATRSVAERTYLITCKDENEANVLSLDIPCEHDLLPFVYLQVFQLIAFKVTDSLNRWQKHPVFNSEFRKSIDYKVRKK